MAGIGRVLYRTLFWSYERGSWQYDLAVILIVLFVLATPMRWFHDQPQVGISANASLVEALPHETGPEAYRVDARLLAPPERTPALQNDLHNAMQRARADLRDGHFSIGKIEPIRDGDGNVIAYRVEIQR